jgi:hypothetical protein
MAKFSIVCCVLQIVVYTMGSDKVGEEPFCSFISRKWLEQSWAEGAPGWTAFPGDYEKLGWLKDTQKSRVVYTWTVIADEM